MTTETHSVTTRSVTKQRRIIWEPLPGKIVVRTASGERHTDAGLILLSDPATSRIGEVIAVYEPFHDDEDDDYIVEPQVKKGDIVVFGRNNGVSVQIERDRCTILREAEILTKIRFEEVES